MRYPVKRGKKIVKSLLKFWDFVQSSRYLCGHRKGIRRQAILKTYVYYYTSGRFLGELKTSARAQTLF